MSSDLPIQDRPAEKDERIFVGVSGNLDPERNIRKAIERMAERVAIKAISTFYRTEPMNRTDQPDYLNGVVEIRTSAAPRELKLGILRPIEDRLGRQRSADKYASRPIDLDILWFGRRVIASENLSLPAEDIERSFVLIPLLELAPELTWPTSGQPLSSHKPGHEVPMTPVATYTRQLREAFLL